MPILVLGDQRYEYRITDWTNKDGMALEAATGMSWGEWVDGLTGEGTIPLIVTTSLVWMVLRKNGQPNLKVSDVEYPLGGISFDPDEDQLAALAAEEAAKEAEPAEDPTPAVSPRSRARKTAASRGSGTPASPS